MEIKVTAKAQCNYFLHGNEVYSEFKYFEPFDYEGDLQACYDAALVYFEEQCDAVNTACSQDSWSGEVTLDCRWDKSLSLWEEF